MNKRFVVIAALVVLVGITGVLAITLSGAAPNPNLKGDIDNNNRVDISDLSLLLASWNKSSANDLNADSRIDISDLSILLGNWNKTYTPGTPPVPPTPPTPPVGSFKPGFVYRDGKNLMLDGQKWRFVGVNNYDLTGCHTGNPLSQAAADTFFSGLRPNSLTRIWAFEAQGESGIATTVAAAAKYNQKIMFALADGAEYCGEPDLDGSWYSSGYKAKYFSWISKVVPKYKDSPAVGAWEIMNEPGQNASGMSQATMKSFYDTTAAKIKSLDPNHLVSTGTLAPYQSFQSGVSGYANVHSGPNIDLVSMHEYDYAYESSRTIVSPHYKDAKAAADQISKPVFIGETGITLASGCMTADQRAAALKQKFDGYLNQGAAGVLYWVVLGSPNNSGSVCNEMYGNRDPMTGPVMTMIKGYQFPN